MSALTDLARQLRRELEAAGAANAKVSVPTQADGMRWSATWAWDGEEYVLHADMDGVGAAAALRPYELLAREVRITIAARKRALASGDA